MHALERAAARELYASLTDDEAPSETPETFWARRVEVGGLLPLPYDFLRTRAATALLGTPELGPESPGAPQVQQAEEAFWDLLGEAHVRYTEMPLMAASGLELAVSPVKPKLDDNGKLIPLERDARNLPTDEPAQRWYAQWQLTAAYLFHRCDEILLVRAPDGGPDGLDEIAAWADVASDLPDRPGWAATGLFPGPGGAAPSGPGRPVVTPLFRRDDPA
jgi:hypothetical protein